MCIVDNVLEAGCNEGTVISDGDDVRVDGAKVYAELPTGIHVVASWVDNTMSTKGVTYKVVDLSNSALYYYYKEGLEKYVKLLPAFVVKVIDLCRYDMGLTDILDVIFGIVSDINMFDSGLDLRCAILVNNNTLKTLQDNKAFIDKSHKVTLFVDLLDWTDAFQAKRIEKLFELDDSKKKAEDKVKCNVVIKSCCKGNFIIK